MSHSSHPDELEAQRRRLAVQMYREGQHPDAIATQLERSRSWVFYWVAYQHQQPHARFRSASRAAHHHPNQTARRVRHRIVQLRETLQQQRDSRLRYAPIGARTIQRELHKRRVQPCPSLSTIQRILHQAGLTRREIADAPDRYRPHPLAEAPNDVQSTDIITRWLEGGAVVQAFTTVDHFSNAAYATTHAHKHTAAARQHLLETWQTLGLPGLAQFDNESAFRGGRQAHRLSAIVRLCLYVGSQVLFIPEYEADYNWQVEAFNNLWAHQFWNKHRFQHRGRIPASLERFLHWHYTDYVAPRQTDTPARMRRGHSVSRLPRSWAARIPEDPPLCAGFIHAVRCVAENGHVTFLNETFPVGKRYHGYYVQLTLDTVEQTMTLFYQAQAEAEWETLKVFPYRLEEPVQPVPEELERLHV